MAKRHKKHLDYPYLSLDDIDEKEVEYNQDKKCSMTYLDVYPHCIGCPVSKWCGTAVSSIRLCHSYKEPKTTQTSKSFMAVSSEITAKDIDEYAEERIRLSLEIM